MAQGAVGTTDRQTSHRKPAMVMVAKPTPANDHRDEDFQKHTYLACEKNPKNTMPVYGDDVGRGRPRLKLDETLIRSPWVSAEDAAKALGCSLNTVLNRRRELGVQGRGQGKRGPDKKPRKTPS